MRPGALGVAGVAAALVFTLGWIAVFVATAALFVALVGGDGVGVAQRISATAVHVWLAVVAVGVGGLAAQSGPAAP